MMLMGGGIGLAAIGSAVAFIAQSLKNVSFWNVLAVFLIIRQFDYTVLLGAILGFAAAVGNFFLMAFTVQKVTEGMPALPKREQEEEADGSKLFVFLFLRLWYDVRGSDRSA